MTLDEAIKHCLDIADGQDKCAEISVSEHAKERISQCAADHRQLAEWLTDYKELKNSIGAVKFSNMKEALELIREYKAENIAQKKLIAEYKRLLKSATNVLNKFIQCDEDYCSECVKQRQNCDYDDSFKWLYAAEALALIGEDTNVPASADDTNVGHKSGGWISCEERLPEESGTYICAAKSAGRNIVTFVKWQPRYKQWNLAGARSYWQITHWQPLPEPPKDGDRNA